jgi:alpha-tubulin suppressor-like RCC1 family protein
VALVVAAVFPVGALVAAARTEEMFSLAAVLLAAVTHRFVRSFLPACLIAAVASSLLHEIVGQGYLNEMFLIRLIVGAFYAFLVSVAVGLPFVIYRHPGLVGALWRGEVPLARTYWRYGFLLNALFATTALVLTMLADCPECGRILAAPELIPLWWLYYLAYFVVVVIAIWRAAERYPGPRTWVTLARIAVMLDVVRFSTQLWSGLVPALAVHLAERRTVADHSALDSSANTSPAVGAKSAPQPAAPRAFTTVSAGGSHTCRVMADGAAYCWGFNGNAQLGEGTTAHSSSPVPIRVAGGVRFAAVSAGYFHTCGIAAAGAAYCWGSNYEGQLGNGTRFGELSPAPVLGRAPFASVSAGLRHTCGVTAEGAAYCWGENEGGQLGDGTSRNRTRPVPVAGNVSFVAVSAGGGHTCGVTAAGAAYCWGYNGQGQLGDGTTIGRTSPVPVASGVPFAAVSAGDVHTCGVTATGAAYCWGDNRYGELGDGTTTNRSTPVPVAGGLNFTAVSAGNGYACGVASRDAAYCWGSNDGGQLGDGTTTNRSSPVRVAGALRFTALSAGTNHSCAVTAAGAAYCWGVNENGKLGDGTTTNQSRPVLVVQ